VVSLAILADDEPGWRPTSYGYGRWGFRTQTEFPAVKLLDYAAQEQALEANANPFATLTLAHVKAMQTRRSPADRQAWKVRLVRGLYERGLGAEEVRQLFRFIDWLMDLPPALEIVFWEEVYRYQEEKRMPYMPSIERIARTEELWGAIELGLEVKFGAEGLKFMPQVKEIRDIDVLRAIREAIRTATSPAEVRRVWAP
jgi:hypothetical protein